VLPAGLIYGTAHYQLNFYLKEKEKTVFAGQNCLILLKNLSYLVINIHVFQNKKLPTKKAFT
jgi:hypothetical protein